jgi:mannose-6-phosphate isomerase-like protein (cupin superfamily)
VTAIRRVVTGIDGDGHSVVLDDGAAPRTHEYQHIPGMDTTLLWATVAGDLDAYRGVDPTPAVTRDLPGPGETRFLLVRFPPDAVYASPGFDAAAAEAETRMVSPQLAARFEPDSPGMHATDTVDYQILLSGRLDLELDDGRLVALNPGDVVVQCGNRHAWRNPGEHPALLGVVMVGRPDS